MAIEIERKFLVASPDWERSAASSSLIRQAYLVVTPAASVRIRIENDDTASLTIKSTKSEMERAEFEYAIPLEDAEQLMALSVGNAIEKRRYRLPADWGCWEIDVFSGALQGLVIAEIELDHKDRYFDRPRWLGEEITEDTRYSNASLAINGLPRA